jgi:hypothetical protein
VNNDAQTQARTQLTAAFWNFWERVQRRLALLAGDLFHQIHDAPAQT